MNLLLSRLDEQQRRWYVALEAEKLGYGGTKHMATITGINVNTIRKGRRELANNLAGRPHGRVRIKGGGRKPQKMKDKGRRTIDKGNKDDVAPEALALADPEPLEGSLPNDPSQGNATVVQKWVRRSMADLPQQLMKQRFEGNGNVSGRFKNHQYQPLSPTTLYVLETRWSGRKASLRSEMVTKNNNTMKNGQQRELDNGMGGHWSEHESDATPAYP